MLDSLKLRLVWLIIEQKQARITPESSDSEIVQHILEQLQGQIILSTYELSDIYIYVQSRVSLIRDLVELQLVKGE